MTRNHTSRTGRFRLAIVASAVAGLVLTACGGGGSDTNSSDKTPQFGGTLNVGVTGEVIELDPAKGAANEMALGGYSIYDSLMIVEKLGDQPKPNIAKSFESNADFTEWTMKLPTGVKFSDGTSFDADAVKYNMDRHLDPAVASTAASLLSPVKTVEAPDAETVVFKLKYPFANLPYVFSYDGSGTAGYVASPTALKKHGKDYTAHASGVGPYMVKQFALGKDTILVRNPNYWNNDDHKPYLDEVKFKLIPDSQTAYQALQSGDVDYIPTTSPTIMNQAAANKQVNFVQGTGSDQDSIVLNVKQPPFDDIRVRQALSMAIDRKSLVELTTEGLGNEAVNLFPKDDAFDSDNSDPEFDLAGAKKLIAEYKADTGKDVEFTYTCRPTVNTTDVIERQLTAAGMKVKIDVPESATAVAAFFASKYQATCWSMAGFLTPDLLPYRFFYSAGDLNTTGYANKTLDGFLDQARATSDPEKQKEAWVAADKILTEDLPWVWTRSQPLGFISNKNVHSIDLDEPSRLRYYVPTVNNVWLSK